MFKTIRAIALVAATFAVPAISFAQSTTGLTRAQVESQLVALEHAGYRPSAGDSSQYPADIQAAEAKVAAQDPQVRAQPSTFSSAGGVSLNGTSASGAPTHKTTDAGCIGPVDFCNPYFGS